MTTLHSFKDSGRTCFANVRMDNDDPCYISVAQSGVLVKKSKIGIFGAKLYEDKLVYSAAMTAKALGYLHPEQLVPSDISNPVLRAFVNAALHCSSIAEVARSLNCAVKDAESKSGISIDDLEVGLL